MNTAPPSTPRAAPPSPAPHGPAPFPLLRLYQAGLAALIVATVLLGLALRWDRATAWITQLGFDFSHIRHAHSHVGFYGFLTLGWWLVARDAVHYSRRVLLTYLAAVFVATTAFTLLGYNLLSTALSTFIAIYWIVAAFRVRKLPGWLAVSPWGIVAGLILVPTLAITARRNFQLSRELAHVFIAALVFLTFVPVALATWKRPRPPTWAWVITAVGGSIYLVFADRLPWPLGGLLSLAGVALLYCLRGMEAPWPVTWSFRLMGAGMVLLGLCPPLHNEEVRLAAIHFTVLGPLGLTIAEVTAPGRLLGRPLVATLGLGSLGLMVTTMAVAPFWEHALMWQIAAYAGTGLVLAIIAFVLPTRANRPPRDHSQQLEIMSETASL